MQELFAFIRANHAKLLELLLEHLGLTFVSLLLAMALAMPLGILMVRRERLAALALGLAGILQTIPSIALLGFLIPVLGIGMKPAIFALFLYALLPILRNTYTGLRGLDPAVLEAARGMGMTARQRLWSVELPLALPVLLAGIRTATVINVGVATLAAYIGAGGLGEFIFGGINLNNTPMILAGAIPAALLAVILDQLIARFERRRRRRRGLPAFALMAAFIALGSFSWVAGRWQAGLRAGFDPEFAGRPDGYPALTHTYGLEVNSLLLNSTLMYEALHAGEVDLISGYSTDGRIKAYQLFTLADDRHVFPPYFCAPLIRQETAEQYPELVRTLNLLAGRLPDSLMTELNYRVDYGGELPREVARSFLTAAGLWQPDRSTGGPLVRIGSKAFTEQYILTEIYAQLIDGYTDLDTDPRAGLGGTKICFEALRAGEIDLYPEYTGTGLQVILQTPDSVLQIIKSDPGAVYEQVSKDFAANYALTWLEPLGFNNTYALITRQDLARKHNWKKISDLVKH